MTPPRSDGDFVRIAGYISTPIDTTENLSATIRSF